MSLQNATGLVEQIEKFAKHIKQYADVLPKEKRALLTSLISALSHTAGKALLKCACALNLKSATLLQKDLKELMVVGDVVAKFEAAQPTTM